MLKTSIFLLALTTFSVANAQSADVNGQGATPGGGAPIVRTYPGANSSDGAWQRPRASRRSQQIVDSQPVSGVWLRSESDSVVKTVTTNAKTAEFRLEQGRLNVTVHQPAQHIEILVDLPGGQASLLKDGLYTFNAETNTVRVLRGEAAAYPAAQPGVSNTYGKPMKVKEDHQLVFAAAGGGLRAVEAYPFELTADLLPLGGGDRREYEGYEYGDGYPPYGYGFYGYPYYAGGWGYPWGWGYGYPYAYGIGFGYYGGFRGGYGGFRR